MAHAEVQMAEGKLYLFVAIDRTSKFAVTQAVPEQERRLFPADALRHDL